MALLSSSSSTSTSSSSLYTISGEGIDNDDSSIVSWSSNSICRRFPFLLNVKSMFQNNNNNSNNSMEADALKEKEEEIQYCLNGINEEVDLWMLRDLALSRGGLVSSSIRKQAWPKLVGAHMQILQPRGPLCPVSNSSLKLLQRDVASTVWNVQEHVAMARQEEEEVQRLTRLKARQKRKTGKKARAPNTKTNTKTKTSHGPTSISTPTSPRSPTSRAKQLHCIPDLTPAVSEEVSEDGVAAHDSNEDLKPQRRYSADYLDTSIGTSGSESIASIRTPTTLETTETAATPTAATSSLPKRRRASKGEQRVLFNIIVSVLRMTPTDSPYFEDDRYKMYRGLTDIAALLLIQLESPSLTSLVLGRLAECSLRDAMRSTLQPLQAALDMILKPLLDNVDGPLANHLRESDVLTTVCIPWIQCWFCPQFASTQAQIVARLLDAFIASHAVMPIYFCVAFLTRSRHILLATPPDKLQSILSKLPCTAHITMDAIEDMIEVSLSYLSRFPPSQWCHEAKHCGGVAMLQRSPEPLPSTAPTDYAVLQHAKALRMSGKRMSPRKSIPLARLNYARYPKAIIATGSCTVGTTKRTKRIHQFSVMIILFILVVGLTWIILSGHGSSVINIVQAIPQQAKAVFASVQNDRAASERHTPTDYEEKAKGAEKVLLEVARQEAKAAEKAHLAAEAARREAEVKAAEKTRIAAEAAKKVAKAEALVSRNVNLQVARREAEAAENARIAAEAAEKVAKAEALESEKVRLDAARREAMATEKARIAAEKAVKAKAQKAADKARAQAEADAAAAAEKTKKQAAAKVDAKKRRAAEKKLEFAKAELAKRQASAQQHPPAPVLATAFQPILQQAVNQLLPQQPKPVPRKQPVRNVVKAIGRSFSSIARRRKGSF